VLFAADWLTFRQLTVSGFFRGCGYGLLGVGFAMILGVTGRFHFAYGFTYTLAVYLAFTFTFRGPEFPFWPAAILGVVLTACLGAGIERTIYRPLANNAGSTALLAVFVASLGLGIAGDNIIRLLWGSETQAYSGPTRKIYDWWDVTFTSFDVWQGVSAAAVVAVLTVLLRYTSLGRRIKATRSNPDLARTIGIDADRIYVIAFFIGTFCAGVAAIWSGLRLTVDPGMGYTPVIYSFVIAFLAGTASSPVRVFFTGIVLIMVEQYSSMWLSVQWTQTFIFVVLVAYLSVLAIKSSAWRAKFRRPSLAKV
jgi:branched-subunit amino acid ABC-type transport system permease component